jgi:uncharacterized protein (TIGR02246 family)
MQPESYDETLIRDLHEQMIIGWNHVSGAQFARGFCEDADFVAFDGTHLKGRKEIEIFHTELFETELHGSRLEGGVHFVRYLRPDFAVVYAWAAMALPGQTNASASRDSVQMFVATKREGQWAFEAMLNARRITTEQQDFADQFESLSALAQRQVTRKVAAMRH